MVVYRINFFVDNFRQLKEHEQKSLNEYVKNYFARFGGLEDYDRTSNCVESSPVGLMGQVFHVEWEHPSIDKFPIILESLVDMGKAGCWSQSTGVLLKPEPVSYSQTSSSVEGKKVISVECHNSICGFGADFYPPSLDKVMMDVEKLSGHEFEAFVKWLRVEEKKRETKNAEEAKIAEEKEKIKKIQWIWNRYDPILDQVEKELHGNTEYYQLAPANPIEENKEDNIIRHETDFCVFQTYVEFLWGYGGEHFDNFPRHLKSKILSHGQTRINGIEIFSIDVDNDGNYTDDILDVCLKAAQLLCMKPPVIGITHEKRCQVEEL